MKALMLAVLFAATWGVAIVAKADDPKQTGPGTTGQMNKAPPAGVATDPEGVKAQQGDTSKASPGTVGASPGGDTKSQTGK